MAPVIRARILFRRPFFARTALLFLFTLLLGAPSAPGAENPEAPGLTVMLKLDDLVRHGKGPDATVSPRWQRVTDFLEREKIKANFGLLADSLEGDCPGYVGWIKQRLTNGYVELWHHGYYTKGLPEAMQVKGRTGEYVGGTAADQGALFQKSLALAKAKLGTELVAFGPHSTAVDAATYEALEGIPQIRLVWFYGPPKDVRTSKVVVQRLMNLEKPLFVPNPASVREEFEKKKATLPYIALQGHPNQWNDVRFEDFQKAVLLLRDQHCRFVTASGFLAEQAGRREIPKN
jgi:peptidoglycan/xylan/chitin deacetylase (PgdA/CDA1 family)